MKRFFVALGLLVGVFGLIWVIQGNSFFMYKFFAPKFEQARREVFEQTKSYNQGMIQEISAMQFDYIKADPDHKKALAFVILHRTADYDLSKLPIDLRNFIDELKKEMK